MTRMKKPNMAHGQEIAQNMADSPSASVHLTERAV